MSNNRRDFLKKSALLGIGGLAGTLLGNNKFESLEKFSEETINQNKPFSLPALPYAYDALEPFIDKETMEIHHKKHHQAYIDKLNGLDLSKLDLNTTDDEKCKTITNASLPTLKNNLGGHYNHTLFWTLLKPNPSNNINLPKGVLLDAINKTFMSLDGFKKEFSDKALKIFGSGWCWLVLDATNVLKIVTTANQNNPLMNIETEPGRPILALDVWEHAYYLKYLNKRVDYIANWWNIVNWDKAEELFTTK